MRDRMVIINKHITDFALALGQDYIEIKNPQGCQKEMLEWTSNIWNNEYTAYQKVRELLPDEVWARYFRWKEHDHKEMILLDKAKRKLRSAILSSKKPTMLKKLSDEKSQLPKM